MSGKTVYTDYSSKGGRTAFYAGKKAHNHGSAHTYVVSKLVNFDILDSLG